MDGDSFTDIVALTERHTITWFKNIDGRGTFDVREDIIQNTNTVSSMHFSDMDADGDADVLMTSRNADLVAWYENDGSHRFVERRVARAHSASTICI